MVEQLQQQGLQQLTLRKNILVEGVECAGKTTLIDEMRRKIPGWDLKYLGHKPGNQFQRYMWEYMVNNGTIFNRSHFSEVVYSDLRQREQPFTDAERTILDEMAARDSLIIFCDPRIEDAKSRYIQRASTQPVELHELEVVHKLFREVFQNIPHAKYESKDMSVRDQFIRDLPKLLLSS